MSNLNTVYFVKIAHAGLFKPENRGFRSGTLIKLNGIVRWMPQRMNKNAYPGPHRRANIATIAWYQVDTFCDGLVNVDLNEFRQQPCERLISIDMSGPKNQIMDEITHFVDRTHELSKVHPDLISQTDAHAIAYRNYTKWQVDGSRKRKEVWVQLKVWKLWKQGKGYKQIARELGLTRDATAKDFHKAYKRIYNTPYDRLDVLENEKSQIEKPDLERFCKNCPYSPYQTCKNPCPEFLELIEMFISQDEVTFSKVKCETDMNLPEDCEDPLGYLNSKYKEVTPS